MYRIAKQFKFSASHQLVGVPEGHKCARLHGHNYRVEIILASLTLSEPTRFVVDYGDLNILKQFIDDQIDHRHLNDVFEGTDARSTTAEDIAMYLYYWCKKHWHQTEEVRVSETENTWASYKEDR